MKNSLKLKNQILNEFEKSLLDVEKNKQIDPIIFVNIKKLKNFLNNCKEKWLKISNTDGFYFYSAIYNVEKILDEIDNKLYNSKSVKDNPKLAMDSLTLLPTIDDIFKITELYKTDKESIELVLNKTRDLRNMAANTYLPRSSGPDKYFFEYLDGSEFNQIMTNLTGGIKN